MAGTATATENDIQQIRALDRYFETCIRNKDASALFNGFYASNARLMPPNHPAAEGQNNVTEVFNGLISAGAKDLVLDTQIVEVSGDLACGIGVYTMTIAPAGAPEVRDSGKYVVVYRRQADGQFRAIYDIFNSNMPAA